ncbi:MAG: MerR family transcriptional regulator [Thermomicrobiales bacterium]|nr:MerR family transcriptional regulator [Thermomicrobiales bacterium]MCO5219276.1 MerR family transcriptional regulator [Thermomicrobiales bacterium]MCO5224033.1 MerR family transcriptional regulator [Thermomicrobiales bacterium]MCO5226853.1 MerR family transcriptional regulator [Thermomicrobiales bacterium]
MVEKWTIQEVARVTGTTSRTLRHYDAIGLLPPTEIGENGYRLYDTRTLIRLQRILALRDLGMSLPDIGAVLADEVSEVDALASLKRQLRAEAVRLDRQIASIQRTITALARGESPMRENMFDGFQHEQYRDEVEERWSKDAWKRSNDWWSGQSDDVKNAFMQTVADLNRDWQQAFADGVSPDSDVAQTLAARHVAWLRSVPGTPAGDGDVAGYVRGLGEMYVNDPRFAANYGGEEGAMFVRDALAIWVERHP